MIDVDTKTRALLDLIAALGEPPPAEVGIVEFRARRARGRFLINPTAPDLAIVRDTEIAGADGALKARLYDTEDGPARPALLFFHGGGFCYGDLDSHDALCRRLALHGGFRVIAVDYRLAPEHPFPAAVNDAVAALAALAGDPQRYGVDASRLAVGGDSAGACLSTVAARTAARAGGPRLRFQLLIYPVVQAGAPTPSRKKFAEGYFLTRETMDWFDAQYLLPDTDRTDERVSPLNVAPPEDLAPALVITAGFDPLLDEGRAYAAALGADHIDYPDQIHGFFSFTAFSNAAEEAIARAAGAVAKALQKP